MFNFDVFIPKKTSPKLIKPIEDIIADCAGDALGKNYFKIYFDFFGDASGLGKTYEKTFNYRLKEIPGLLVIDQDDARSPIDCVFKTNEETVGVQVKTTYEPEKWINLARVSEEEEDGNTDVAFKLGSFKTRLEKYMEKNNVTSFYVAYVTTSDGRIKVYKLAEIKKKKFRFLIDDPSLYSYSKKQTPFYINVSQLIPLKTKKVPGLFIVEKEKSPKKKLLTEEQFVEEVRICAKKFKEVNSKFLGYNWGDKGLAFESMLLDQLLSKYSNVKKGQKMIDYIIEGFGNVQLKTQSIKSTKNKAWIVFSRSSVDNISVIDTTDHVRFFDDEPIPVKPKKDLTVPRKEAIERRLQSDIEKSGESLLYLCYVNLYINDVDLYILSEMCEDKTLKHHGTFMSKDHFKSIGGENGNQSHCYIRMKGLDQAFIPEVDGWFVKK